ncbi:hypothetical protein H6F67_18210 [Microcoleus sp. FACHB-1515]|uniref:calcium-binding protein n=1 Tax=Cyanophyceae TaxID=3028117 RepID=UPI001686B5C8|nr:hypothetical protein [Microcoleus sp. FACHB-1515]MBD2091782.1 hypothetical protein [Microcoleus sp. FACHB-1515]
MSFNPTLLYDSPGDSASDTAYVVTAASGGGTTISDSGGTDSLTFTDASPTLAKRTPGVMGFDRFSTNLYVDLNRDGQDVWTEDLTIVDFFANPSSNLPGRGFIETIGGISGTDILAADFSIWPPPFFMPFLRSRDGDAGDTTFVIDVAGGVTYIEDRGGIDTVTFTGGSPTLGLFAPGVMGFARSGVALQVDLNRDGKFTLHEDLAIESFFAESRKIGAGSGFIENVGGIPGAEILKLNLGAGGTPDKDGSTDFVFSPSYAAGGSLGTGAGVNDGTDTIIIVGVRISPAAMERGTVGFARLGKDLGIDLNRDGKYNVKDDFAILDFFKNFRTNEAGIGCFEIINGISSGKILNLDLTEGNDDLTGGEENDTLVGGAGNDNLTGEVGRDTLIGDTGRDTLSGGTGTDRLTGGEGADDFQFGSVSPSRSRSPEKMSIDRITDFERGEDSIVLRRSTFGNVDRSDFRTVRTIAQARNSDAEITYIQRTGALFYNQNGAAKGFGSGGQFADLANGLQLTASDFSIAR